MNFNDWKDSLGQRHITSLTTIAEFDTSGKIVLRIQPTKTDTSFKRYYYNAKGLLDSTIGRRGTGIIVATERFQYDSAGHILAEYRNYNDREQHANYTYSNDGRDVVKRNFLTGKINTERVSRLSYDANGNLITYKTRNQVTVFQYDRFNNLIAEEHTDSAKGIVGHKTVYQYNHFNGEVVDNTVTTDAHVARYQLVFDKKGNWVSRSSVNKDGRAVLLAERTITYY